jgi:fructoselysine-6-P-deglycase FrlB-like protein
MALADFLERELTRVPDFRVNLVLDEEAVLTGAGDSMAAAVVAEGLRPDTVRALDPLVLMARKVKERTLVAVSVSGKTARVVQAAKRQKAQGKRVIAVTANPESPLTSVADSTVVLPYSGEKGMPGAFTFVETVYALAKMLGIDLTLTRKSFDVYEVKPMNVYLGCNETRGIAYFASLKSAEVFGWASLSESLELFAHSPMFARGLEELVIFSCGSKLEDKFLENFPRVTLIRGSVLDQAYTVIHSTLMVVRRLGIERPYFTSDQKALRLSSEIIYNEI